MGLDSTRLGTVTPPAPAITSRDHPMSTFERMLTVLRARLGNQGRDLAALTRPGEPQRRGRYRVNKKALNRLATCGQAERLEPRLALTINVFSPSVEVANIAPWFVITSDKADDVYVQQVATVPQNLLIADNPSFNDAKSLNAFHAEGSLWNGVNIYSQMYATNGTRVSADDVLPTDSGNDSLFVLLQPIPSTTFTAGPT